MEYTIAGADDVEKLELLVAQMIREGWQPHGGLAIVSRIDKTVMTERHVSVFYQAMTRRGESDWRED